MNEHLDPFTSCKMRRIWEYNVHHGDLLLLLFSRVVASTSQGTRGPQHARLLLSFTRFWSLLRLISTESVMPSNHLITCQPLLLPPSMFPSIRVFSNELALCIRWPKYWSFSFSISPSSDYLGLISFRIDWFDLLAVQGTLKSLFQHCSSKASIFWCSAFFIVQLSPPYITTEKTIALTIRTFFSKVMSLLFILLSRFVIVFFPRRKCLLISLQIIQIIDNNLQIIMDYR